MRQDLRDQLGAWLEDCYRKHHRRALARHDPLSFLYHYPALADREMVGLIAASLAFGRVAQILRSVQRVLDQLGPTPAAFLDAATDRALASLCAGALHRWVKGADLSALLMGLRRMRAEYGSLGACFHRGVSGGEPDVMAPLAKWVAVLRSMAPSMRDNLIPDPARGSACKRLHLYLRWMVRRDKVDPGGWDFLPPAMLIVPLDVHMHRIARALRLTRRRSADRATALEITKAFRQFAPEDPVRYDFALTRLGILQGMTEQNISSACRNAKHKP